MFNALQVTFGGDDIARMNRRNRLISNEWKELIADARTVFSGRMTYAANFDEYFDVSWWRYLDMVGINAYFPLREVSDIQQHGRGGSIPPAAQRGVFRH
jgi:hypothetical protein